MEPNQPSPGPLLHPRVFPGLRTVATLRIVEIGVLGWLQTQQYNEKTSKSGQVLSSVSGCTVLPPILCYHWYSHMWLYSGMVKGVDRKLRRKKKKSVLVLADNCPVTGVSMTAKAGEGWTIHPRRKRAALQRLGCRQRSAAVALYPSQRYPTSRNTINSSVLGALKGGRGA